MSDGKLQALYDELKAEGFSRFHIDGIGGTFPSDVEILIFEEGLWQVYYTERGHKGPIMFASEEIDEAIEFYRNHVSSFKHSHIVVFTRSLETVDGIKDKLQKSGIEFWENDIPHYKRYGDRIFRLFVFNKNVFKAQALLGELPVRDVQDD